MKLDTATFPFQFLTDCFSGTAEGKNATHSDLRVPPIRGHVRMWHISAFGAASCNETWGSTAGDGVGSRIGMKLTSQPPLSNQKSEVLPHKENSNQRGSRPALIAGDQATLELTRLPLCNNDQWIRAKNAVKLWLLLGTLGLRSARAAGSVWPVDEPANHWVPNDPDEMSAIINNLGLSNQSIAIIGLGKEKSPSELRHTASDTVSNSEVFGAIKPTRIPSPTRFKVVKFGDEFCLLAHATRQIKVIRQGETESLLQRAESFLNKKHQPARWKDLGAWKYIVA